MVQGDTWQWELLCLRPCLPEVTSKIFSIDAVQAYVTTFVGGPILLRAAVLILDQQIHHMQKL